METKVSYDALGNIISEEDPTGAVTKYQYNAESLLTKVTYANNVSTTVAYDLAGNAIRETDAEGHTKKYIYDEVNRLTGVTDELGNTTSYAYDAFDNISRVTDALGHVTEYTYDTHGNLLSETDALGNTVQYSYTPEGWLEQVTKADGNVIRFEYDKTGTLLRQDAGEGYTVSSSYNELGQVTEVGSDAGTITYQYNDQGRLISVTNVNGEKVSYTWDEYGNKTGMVYPDGREVRYTYDTMDRMTEVIGLEGEVTRYTYDANGRRILTETAENTTTYEYDRIGSLVRQETTGVGAVAFTYSYNKNGYLTKEKRTEGGETTESNYTYDAMSQLTGFRQNTGYGEKYTYDAAGNMLQKQITGTDGKRVQLTMQYNEGNQLTETTVGNERLTYSYDPNGSMTAKNLTGSYGTLTDTYTYNVLDQLTEYVGYDGYRQKYTYDANSMRMSKETYGNGNRSTLEELLRGDIAGLPEVILPEAQENAVENEYEWATEEYLYDITQEYYVVIAKTETTATGSCTTAYAYGLERITEYAQNQRTTYVYDGRGSVAKTVTTLKEGDTREQNYIYTAFGEQMGTQKVSGFGYNAEAYDTATGMINLRARQYEPAVGRFEQKDIIAGSISTPSSQNAYTYVMNRATIYADPSGMKAVCVSVADVGGGKAKGSSTSTNDPNAVLTAVNNVIAKLFKNATKQADGAAKATNSAINEALEKAIRTMQIYKSAKEEIASIDPDRPTAGIERQLIWKRACSLVSGDDVAVNEITDQLKTVQSYDKVDWLFLTGDRIFDDSISDEERFSILNVLKEKGTITAEDMIELGLYTEDTRYNYYFFGIIREDVAGNFAALLDLSYRLAHQGTTVWEMNLEEQQMRLEEQRAMLYYLGIQAGLSSMQAYNAAGSAIRMPGASIATPGCESAPSDSEPFNFDKYTVKCYNPARNGPLSNDIAITFRSASYSEVTLSEDTVFYRVYGGETGKVGRFLTAIPQNGGLQSQIDLALNPDWGNTAEFVTTVTVPKGITIYVGTAAPQIINGGAGTLIGGGSQIYIPEVDALWFGN